ncbi:MAG: hypothetical protein EAZ21_04495 [Betaproteobacteria bacterium]|nr:MAG: hypothetical protein EAZ21_04495 [Betaproteobacteria bacterium]
MDDRTSQSNTEVESQLAMPARARKMRKTARLQLVLISAAAASLVGCGRLENDTTSRDVYANLEECRADWGNPEDCEEIDEKRSATGTRSFYGPRYTSRTGSSGGYSTTTRPGSRAKGTVSSGANASRGGFGSSSSRHSSSSYSG